MLSRNPLPIHFFAAEITPTKGYGAESYSTSLSKQRCVTQVGAVAGKGRNPPPLLLAIVYTLMLRL